MVYTSTQKPVKNETVQMKRIIKRVQSARALCRVVVIDEARVANWTRALPENSHYHHRHYQLLITLTTYKYYSLFWYNVFPLTKLCTNSNIICNKRYFFFWEISDFLKKWSVLQYFFVISIIRFYPRPFPCYKLC